MGNFIGTGIVYMLIAIVLISVGAYLAIKEKAARSFCVLFYAAALFVIYLAVLNFMHASFIYGLRSRINEPVVSEAQLYGYEIIGKKEPLQQNLGQNVYLVKIKDLLKNSWFFTDEIKVSEKFFQEHKIGDRFPSELDPNIPAMENQ